ncbi:translation initiation factor IF-2 [Suicoccus acidiformans]|uniref:Translation initiation factor IF-2 n=1 Tax=Suicoccus acidiformans TaxID=2036206 RepID=A0A347WK68_9LACT|nr:translation initiation factor IF-2 [Suicoccus acidiformans]AXY25475.1 translation initiation factor IF-2 [Suicoccus acidiformans]
MTAKRIYEFAKENDMTSKAMLELAKDAGLEFGSHMSSISPEEQTTLKKAMANPGKSKQEQKSTQKPRQEKGQGQSASKGDQKRQNQNDRRQGNQAKDKPKNNKRRNKSGNNQATQQGNQDSNQEGGRRRNRRNRRRNRNQNRNHNQPQSKGITQRKYKDLPESFEYSEGMNIQDIAKIFHRDATEIIKRLMMLGVMANQNQALSKDIIELIAMEYGVEAIEKVEIDVSDLEQYFEAPEGAEVTSRPPVVTIMGHVDHGKTTLLDQLRHTRVTEGEAGGITQHIGAYQVEASGQMITFLDTPGHEAFTTMRARGADVTDIAIIVVAADDGVMPQTVEAISHAKAANVPIIVAINKIDKPEANPDRIKNEMTEHELIPEEWGGDTIFVEISAKNNTNIDELLEMVLLVAEVQELTAVADRLAVGSVIEARLDKGQGATATLLVQEGTLNVGDPIVVGNTYGRVRTMVNDQGRRIREAGPATPVEITGLNDAPQAGDLFVVYEDEKTARQAGEERAKQALLEARNASQKVTLDNLFETLQEGELKSVNVIIKADVQGSAEALSASLQKIDVEGVKVNIVHSAVGAINESDISLAAASGAIVIGFNVRPTPQARQEAEAEEIDIRQYRVIYDAIDEVETAMKGLLDPEFKEEVQGQAIVRETFTVSKLGTIAGSFVTDGYIARSSQVRLIRDNIVIYEGDLKSLRRFQDDVREVTKGFECGIMIEGYNDIKIDDVIEAFHMVEVKPS